MPSPPPIFRAPMRARVRTDVPAGAGAELALDHGLVGIGDVLERAPARIEDAVDAAAAAYGAKAARALARFAALPDGVFVWTRDRDGAYFLGQVAGAWRYADCDAARQVGIHHVRPATWRRRPFHADETPGAVLATFGRGGRNLQRIHGEAAERRTAELWDASR